MVFYHVYITFNLPTCSLQFVYYIPLLYFLIITFFVYCPTLTPIFFCLYRNDSPSINDVPPSVIFFKFISAGYTFLYQFLYAFPFRKLSGVDMFAANIYVFFNTYTVVLNKGQFCVSKFHLNRSTGEFEIKMFN